MYRAQSDGSRPTMGFVTQGRDPLMKRTRRARIALTAAITGAALFAALPGAASAGVLVASAPSCDNGATAQPFAQWGDSNNYFLTPGGNFESGASGWTLNGAHVVADQEPWRVNGDRGSHALVVPAGRSGVSPPGWVGIEKPSMRFFAHRPGGGLLGATSPLPLPPRLEGPPGPLVEGARWPLQTPR